MKKNSIPIISFNQLRLSILGARLLLGWFLLPLTAPAMSMLLSMTAMMPPSTAAAAVPSLGVLVSLVMLVPEFIIVAAV